MGPGADPRLESDNQMWVTLSDPRAGTQTLAWWLSVWGLSTSHSAFLSTLVSVTGWAWDGLEWTSGPFLWFLAGRVQEGQLCIVFPGSVLAPRDSSYSFWLPQPPRRWWERARPGPEQPWPWRAAT